LRRWIVSMETSVSAQLVPVNIRQRCWPGIPASRRMAGCHTR
jgi:hypothetical protein